MAGGQGTRLWPLSRKKNPKQLHALASEKPLIRETFERLLPKFKPKEIIVSTTPDFLAEISRIIPEIPTDNFIVEPFLMGNAAACGLVSKILSKRDPKSSVIFLPSDHIIKDGKKFIETLDFADSLIKKYPKHILTIGINPTKPDVNLGYIQMSSQIESQNGSKAFSVKAFIEKPDLKTAQKYLSSWEYLWNAGIFIWRTDHILEMYKKELPKTYKALLNIGEHLEKPEKEELIAKEYSKVDNTSIDYGIMEKTKDIIVIPGNFGWSDIGTWGSLYEVLSEMKATDIIARGHHIGVDNKNCLIYAGEKLIATAGLKNIVIIDTPDATLICDKNESHKIKELLKKLGEEFL